MNTTQTVSDTNPHTHTHTPTLVRLSRNIRRNSSNSNQQNENINMLIKQFFSTCHKYVSKHRITCVTRTTLTHNQQTTNIVTKIYINDKSDNEHAWYGDGHMTWATTSRCISPYFEMGFLFILIAKRTKWNTIHHPTFTIKILWIFSHNE